MNLSRLGTPDKSYGKEKGTGEKKRKSDLCPFPVLKELVLKESCSCISAFAPYQKFGSGFRVNQLFNESFST